MKEFIDLTMRNIIPALIAIGIANLMLFFLKKLIISEIKETVTLELTELFDEIIELIKEKRK